jgi:TPR repeat protein
LGDTDAHCQLGFIYWNGKGVEEDKEKAVNHYEKAAIGGHPRARHNLACIEGGNGNVEKAAKHWIIAANLGYENSMKSLWLEFKDGNITKEDLDGTLRIHQAAIDETKSEQRKAGEAFFRGL